MTGGDDTTRTGARGAGSVDPPGNGLDDTLAAGQGRSSGSAEPGLGDRVGRYLLLRRLGAGAMGVVYAAHDPELQRHVAIKLLLPDVAEHRQTRMLREAQVLAQLAHPNIVAIHDVGAHRGRVFIAMELVHGLTLRDWLAEHPRRWPEVLSVLLPAARGLAAAHTKDLVHRDFKPDNVMVDDDGRVRVMDFGLAKSVAEGPPDSTTESEVDVVGTLSATGATAGTPAYMSPEQWAGETTGPAADLFAFCATAWEAVFGARPFRGDTAAALSTAIGDGEIADPPPGASVPRWLRRVLRRGLRVRAGDRWASMQALVEAIETGLARRRRRRWAAGAGAVAVIAGGGLVAQRWAEQRRQQRCRDGAALADAAWADARPRVHASLGASEPLFSKPTLASIDRTVDAWTAQWRETSQRLCLGSDGSDPTFAEHAQECLDDRLDQLRALVAVLGQEQVGLVEAAVDAANSLPSPERCGDRASLAARPRLPRADVARAHAVRVATLRCGVLISAGAVDEALTEAREAVAAAEAIGFAPLTAEARIVYAEALGRSDRFDEAVEAFERAYLEAAAAGASEHAADAARELTWLLSDIGRHDAARAWANASEGALGARHDTRRRARLLHNRAVIASDVGDPTGAIALYDEVLELNTGTLGENHPDMGSTLYNLSTIHRELGQLDAADREATRALEIFETVYGPSHPRVAMVMQGVALVRSAQGRRNEAIDISRRALAVIAATRGPDHSSAAFSYNAIGNAQLGLDRPRDALLAFERARTIFEATFGPEHDVIASVINNIGNVHDALGDTDKAVAAYERALAIGERVLGLRHPEVASTLRNLGEALSDLGRDAEAAPRLERALELLDIDPCPDPPQRVLVLDDLGRLRRRQGRFDEAVALLQRAIDVEPGGVGSDKRRSAAQLGLARALVARPSASEADHARAVELAERALATATAHELRKVRQAAQLWLAEHRPARASDEK